MADGQVVSEKGCIRTKACTQYRHTFFSFFPRFLVLLFFFSFCIVRRLPLLINSDADVGPCCSRGPWKRAADYNQLAHAPANNRIAFLMSGSNGVVQFTPGIGVIHI